MHVGCPAGGADQISPKPDHPEREKRKTLLSFGLSWIQRRGRGGDFTLVIVNDGRSSIIVFLRASWAGSGTLTAARRAIKDTRNKLRNQETNKPGEGAAL